MQLVTLIKTSLANVKNRRGYGYSGASAAVVLIREQSRHQLVVDLPRKLALTNDTLLEHHVLVKEGYILKLSNIECLPCLYHVGSCAIDLFLWLFPCCTKAYISSQHFHMASSDNVEKFYETQDFSVDSPSSDSAKISSANSSQLDDNYALYQQHAGQALDPLEAKRVLRKIDLRIVPILIMIYLLQYLDKNGINYASVFGLQEGTHLTGQVRSPSVIYRTVTLY